MWGAAPNCGAAGTPESVHVAPTTLYATPVGSIGPTAAHGTKKVLASRGTPRPAALVGVANAHRSTASTSGSVLPATLSTRGAPDAVVFTKDPVSSSDVTAAGGHGCDATPPAGEVSRVRGPGLVSTAALDARSIACSTTLPVSATRVRTPPMAVSDGGAAAVGDAAVEKDAFCDALCPTDTLFESVKSAEGVARDVESPDGDGVADEFMLGTRPDKTGVALTTLEPLKDRLALTGAVPDAE